MTDSSARGAPGPARLPVDPDLPSPPRRGARPPFAPLHLLLVFLGGATGTLGRYELSLAMPDHLGSFPWTTLVINVSGSFLIGVILTTLVEFGHAGPPRLFSCVGMLGGWTTMSTLALDADELVAQHRVALMLAYSLGSILLGALAAGVGILVAERGLQRRTVPATTT